MNNEPCSSNPYYEAHFGNEAQTSEPQEWTQSGTCVRDKSGALFSCPTADDARSAVSFHNAALAAERERTKQQGKTACELFDECKKLQAQLAAERGKVKRYEDDQHDWEESYWKCLADLEAEQGKVKTLVEALTKAKPIVGAAVAASSNESRPLREKVYNLIVVALAKVKDSSYV
jgi:hypothetical protein